MNARPLLATLLLLPQLLLAGCTATPQAAPPPNTAAAPAATPAPAVAPATPRIPDDDLWVATSAEYPAAAWQAYQLAGRRIDELARGKKAGSWAVILDVDETVLSNVEFELDLAKSGKDFDEASWRAWENRGTAPVIPGARQFIEKVKAMGGRVALVTNRNESQRSGTESNLRRERIPFDMLLLRPEGAASNKNPRFESVQKGTAAPGVPPLEVLMWVGDNIRDFPGLDQSLRQQGEGALAPFGDRFIVIPNPMYGSWLPTTPAAAPTPAPGGGTNGGAVDDDDDDETSTVPVHVDEVQTALLKSLPAQLRAQVRGHLPDPCSVLQAPTVRRSGNRFDIELLARRPKGKMCAQVLTPFETSVEVDIRGLRRGTYTVAVGEKTAEFTLARDN